MDMLPSTSNMSYTFVIPLEFQVVLDIVLLLMFLPKWFRGNIFFECHYVLKNSQSVN